MVAIKSYIDIEQSKKLAEILPIESADMYWDYDVRMHEHYPMIMDYQFDDFCIPCWSLASLFDVLPEIDGSPLNIEKVKAEDGYDGYYYHIEYKDKILIPYSKNPIDACVAMIKRLHELNLL